MGAAKAMWVVNLCLRSAQIVFGLVVLGCSGYDLDHGGDFPGEAGFAVFAGLMGTLWGVFFLLMTIQPAWLKARAPLAMNILESVASGVITVFFLAAGAALVALGACDNGSYFCGNFNAAVAFSWLSFILWLLSTIFIILEWTRVFPRTPASTNAGVPPNTSSPMKAVEVHVQQPTGVLVQQQFPPSVPQQYPAHAQQVTPAQQQYPVQVHQQFAPPVLQQYSAPAQPQMYAQPQVYPAPTQPQVYAPPQQYPAA